MFVIRAFRNVFASLWSIILPVLRLFGWVFAIGAVTTLIVQHGHVATDGSAVSVFNSPSLIDHWRTLAPSSLDATADWFDTRQVSVLWDPILTTLLGPPMWIVFAVLAALLLYATRQQQRVNVYAN
ncbi:MAG: hypothetical protein AAFR23_01685 [Pseudomonadota bacterium]